MTKKQRLGSGLVSLVLVLSSGNFTIGQVQPLEQVQPLDNNDEDGNPFSNRLPKAVQNNNLIDDWINGKHSPDAYKVKNGDDEETRLSKQRINVALLEISHFQRSIKSGEVNLDVAFDSQQRLLHAKLDFHTKPTEVVAAWEEALKSAKSVEAIVTDRFPYGCTIQEVSQATYNRLDIEIQLLRAKKALKQM